MMKAVLPLTCSNALPERYTPPGTALIFNAWRDIDAVAEDILAVNNYVANVDADAKGNLLGVIGVVLRHLALHVDRASHGFDGTRELDQHAIAGGLDDTALVLGNGGIDNPRGGASSALLACRPHRRP